MKTYTEHIFEELVQDNSTEAKLRRYLERRRREHEEFENNRPHPKSREELQDMIVNAIKENGPEVDLNYIDVSKINDMSHLFFEYHNEEGLTENTKILQSFNGDISEWDVSNVTNMHGMFADVANFNGDISEWDVSSVTDMAQMFWGAKNFNCNISSWDTSSVEIIYSMFYDAESFNQPIGTWTVSKVISMNTMFYHATSFDQDLSNWDIRITDENLFDDMFNNGCPIREEYKPESLRK